LNIEKRIFELQLKGYYLIESKFNTNKFWFECDNFVENSMNDFAIFKATLASSQLDAIILLEKYQNGS
jgi:hypothetical protein